MVCFCSGSQKLAPWYLCTPGLTQSSAWQMQLFLEDLRANLQPLHPSCNVLLHLPIPTVSPCRQKSPQDGTAQTHCCCEEISSCTAQKVGFALGQHPFVAQTALERTSFLSLRACCLLGLQVYAIASLSGTVCTCLVQNVSSHTDTPGIS